MVVGFLTFFLKVKLSFTIYSVKQDLHWYNTYKKYHTLRSQWQLILYFYISYIKNYIK